MHTLPLPPRLVPRYAAKRAHYALWVASLASGRLPDLPTRNTVNAILAPYGLMFTVAAAGHAGRGRAAEVAIVETDTGALVARGTGSDTYDAYLNMRATLGKKRPTWTHSREEDV